MPFRNSGFACTRLMKYLNYAFLQQPESYVTNTRDFNKQVNFINDDEYGVQITCRLTLL